eukprot:COSAG05_NODE_5018_length_1288_cov_2.618167_3_plen_53_part_01
MAAIARPSICGWQRVLTACVDLSLMFQKVTIKEKNHPPGSALEPISQAAPPRT